MADLSDRVVGGTRVLTLVGSGGCGKTRLALHVAARVLPAFPGGAWMADLAPITEAEQVQGVVAAAVGVREETQGRAIDAIARHLGDRRVLLVVDNCEHVLDAAAAAVEALVHTAPNVTVLATSRQILSIPGEESFRVPSLEVSPDGAIASSLGLPDALALFLDRARAVQPGYRPSEPQMHAIARICRDLDGIPLAIELAAARISSLSADQIAGRLNDRLSLLTRGSRTATPRQQTLRGAIDWSYSLLDREQKALFRRVAVFSGGFALAAVERVGAAEATDRPKVARLLSDLVDKSLVIAEEVAGDQRYRLLEAIRQFGQEQLDGSGEAELLQRRHLCHFLQIAEEMEGQLTGAGLATALDQLELEYENFRKALDHAAREGRWTEVLRFGAALWRFWERRGHGGEGRRWLAEALARTVDDPSPLRLRAMIAAANLALDQGDLDAAAGLYWRCIALGASLGDIEAVARCHNNLGLIAERQGDYVAARDRFEQALGIARGLGHAWGIATTLNNLGAALKKTGDLQSAQERYEESLGIFRRLGEPWGTAMSLCDLGRLALERGEHARAGSLLRESLRLRRKLKDPEGAAEGLERLAALAAAGGDGGRAARLFGAAEALREAIGVPVPPDEAAEQRVIVAVVERRAGSATFVAAWTAGRELGFDQAVAYALAEASSRPVPGTPTPSISGPSLARTELLTPREAEVVQLIAKGLTARQIGQQLHLSPRTVQKHEEHVRGKLDLPNRAALAAWAERRLHQQTTTSGQV